MNWKGALACFGFSMLACAIVIIAAIAFAWYAPLAFGGEFISVFVLFFLFFFAPWVLLICIIISLIVTTVFLIISYLPSTRGNSPTGPSAARVTLYTFIAILAVIVGAIKFAGL